MSSRFKKSSSIFNSSFVFFDVKSRSFLRFGCEVSNVDVISCTWHKLTLPQTQMIFSSDISTRTLTSPGRRSWTSMWRHKWTGLFLISVYLSFFLHGLPLLLLCGALVFSLGSWTPKGRSDVKARWYPKKYPILHICTSFGFAWRSGESGGSQGIST